MWGVSSNYPSIGSYGAAKETYEKTKPLRGKPDFRPLDVRTSRAKAQILQQGDDYIIRLYRTDIVRYKPDGEVVLDTGGWDSRATAAAMSAMSPYVVWTQEGTAVVRMPDLKKYVIPRYGLIIKDGHPVNPVPAEMVRTRVLRGKTKPLRKYFAEVPKLITLLSALLDGKGRPETPKPDTHPFNKYPSGVLEPEDIAYLAIRSIHTEYAWVPGAGGSTVVTNDPKKSIAGFWRTVYNAFECVESYSTQLPLGEV